MIEIIKKTFLAVIVATLVVGGVTPSASAIIGRLDGISDLLLRELPAIDTSNLSKARGDAWLAEDANGNELLYAYDTAEDGGSLQKYLYKYSTAGDKLGRVDLSDDWSREYPEEALQFFGRDGYLYSTGFYSEGGSVKTCTLKRSAAGAAVSEFCDIPGSNNDTKGRVYAFAALSDGRLIAAVYTGNEGQNDSILVISNSGEYVKSVSLPEGIRPSGLSTYLIPQISVDESDAVYVHYSGVKFGASSIGVSGVVKFDTLDSTPQVVMHLDDFFATWSGMSPNAEYFAFSGAQVSTATYGMNMYDKTGRLLGEAGTTEGVQFADQASGSGVDNIGILYYRNIEHKKINRFAPNFTRAEFTQSLSGKSADLEVGGNASPLRAEIKSQAEIGAPNDTGKSYLFGLLSFVAVVDSTDPVPVEFIVETDLKPSDVEARKYNSLTKQYDTIPNAVITQTAIEGRPALKLAYSVTDGGALDEDGEVNGMIIDPVGLATSGGGANEGGSWQGGVVPGAPSTGVGKGTDVFMYLLTLAGVVGAATIFAIGKRFVYSYLGRK